MSLPPRTRMTLSISCCTGLKKLKEENFDHDKLQAQIEENEDNLLDARRKLHKKMVNLTATDVTDFKDGSTKELRRLQDNVSKAQAIVDSLPTNDKQITPNPFVVVAIDDDDVDRHPMLYTKAVRSTTNPIWKEEFEDFPIEMYLTGKTGLEMFENGDKNYRPQHLAFFVYHDNGVPENGKVKLDDDDWKRDKPQRGICIAKATWDWTDVCRSVGCAEFEKDFQLFNPNTHKKIGKDAKLTIKVRLCAPKIRYCNCMFGKKVDKRIEQVLEHEEFEDESETDAEPEPEPEPKKIVRSRSRKTATHGDDCLCSACRNTGFSKPSKSNRRRLRKKI